MLSWLTSSDFLSLVMILTAAAALCLWEKRRLKKKSEEQWKTLIGTCRTWTPAKTKKSVEAAWITALRESIARDPWQPGLKPSATKARIQSRPSHCDVAEHTEHTPRRAVDAETVAQAQRSFPSRNVPIQPLDRPPGVPCFPLARAHRERERSVGHAQRSLHLLLGAGCVPCARQHRNEKDVTVSAP